MKVGEFRRMHFRSGKASKFNKRKQSGKSGEPVKVKRKEAGTPDKREVNY